MFSTRILGVVALLLLPPASAKLRPFHHDEEAVHHLSGSMLLAALPNATAAESILQSFVALVMHRPTDCRLLLPEVCGGGRRPEAKAEAGPSAQVLVPVVQDGR